MFSWLRVNSARIIIQIYQVPSQSKEILTPANHKHDGKYLQNFPLIQFSILGYKEYLQVYALKLKGYSFKIK